MLPAALIAVAAAAPVLDCDDRITGAMKMYPDGTTIEERFDVDPRRDRVLGPLAFSGLRRYARRSEWAWMVDHDQWLKSIVIVKPGGRVTVTVPRSQRRWMRLTRGNGRAATFVACPRGHKASGPSGNTAFSGGFDIDYAEAPHHGRCAKIVVRIAGRERPLRRRLLAPRVHGCG